MGQHEDPGLWTNEEQLKLVLAYHVGQGVPQGRENDKEYMNLEVLLTSRGQDVFMRIGVKSLMGHSSRT